MENSAPSKPTFKEAFAFWVKLGCISFGGPAGQIAIMHEYLVRRKRWISERKFLHALNYCMLLPGPEAQQLATYTGWLLHGVVGGLVAGIFFVLPSMLILMVLSVLYVSFGNIPWVYAIFDGLKPAIIAIVIIALVKISKKALLGWAYWIVALLAFLGIFFLKIPFPLIILGSIAIAILLKWQLPQIFIQKEGHKSEIHTDENQYYINANQQLQARRFDVFLALKQLGITVLLWLIPLGILAVVNYRVEFWSQLILFFTKAALVTFGGAYAVLPYVAQVSVEKFEWLSQLQMVDGLALGETTPGPLIMVLAFVGFMAGYNVLGGSILAGTIGLVTTTYYTFLPCFLFVFAGAPIIESTTNNRAIKDVLGFVTASVVGVILNLTIYLGLAVLFPKGMEISGFDFIALLWVLVSFAALYRLKINMIIWIGVSAIFGYARFLFGI